MGNGKTACVFGGQGRLGKWFMRFFQEQGYVTDCYDVGDFRPLSHVASSSDMLVSAVPHPEAPALWRSVQQHAKANTIFIDLSSVKTHVAESLIGRGETSLLLHPMWSPQVPTMRGQVLICCELPGCLPSTRAVLRDFVQAGVDLVTLTVEEHDRLMSQIQVVTHSLLIASGLAYARSGYSAEQFAQTESPVYRVLSALVGRLLSHGPQVYADIAFENPYSEEAMRVLHEVVGDLTGIVATRDREHYYELFKEVYDHRARLISNSVRDSALVVDVLSTVGRDCGNESLSQSSRYTEDTKC